MSEANPSEENPWGTLEIKCSLADSVVKLPYSKEGNAALKLKKTHITSTKCMDSCFSQRLPGLTFLFFARRTMTWKALDHIVKSKQP